jgi:hypothetical protein
MEIERGVRIEYGGDFEGGLSSGPRNMEQVPDYTDEELEAALGDVKDEIASVFRQSARDESVNDLAGGGLA